LVALWWREAADQDVVVTERELGREARGIVELQATLRDDATPPTPAGLEPELRAGADVSGAPCLSAAITITPKPPSTHGHVDSELVRVAVGKHALDHIAVWPRVASDRPIVDFHP